MKEFLDPLYGFVELNPLELRLVDSFPFQRLRYIKQLGVAYLVFPSAQHTRFEHSIGVLYTTNRIAEKLGIKDIKLLRLAGLLHDVGHPPFSHTTEVLLPEEKTHEDFTERVIRETEIYNILRKELSHEDIDKLIRITLGKPRDGEEKLLSDVITGEFGSDRLDYLRRDAYFCGVSYGFFDYERLINTLSYENNALLIDESGLRALENFLISRYFMYIQVYFHKVVRILSIHLVEFIKKLFKKEEFKDINNYLRINDTNIIAKIFESKEYIEYFYRIFGRKHFKTLLSTSDKEVYNQVKKEVLKIIPEDKVRFDEVRKEVYGGNIYVRTKKGIFKAHEVSSFIASLRPIEVYRIYVDRSVWKDLESLGKSL
ncbi:HD domain-containing protein [Aquifex sp.]